MGSAILKIIPNTPVNIARIRRINPNRSSASNPGSKLGGRILCRTLLPSSGGIGIKLKTPNATLRTRKTVRSCATPSTTIESFAGTVLLDDHVRNFIDALVARETLAAAEALTPTANDFTFLALARIDDFVTEMTTVGTLHGVTADPGSA